MQGNIDVNVLESDDMWCGNPKDMQKEDLEFFGLNVVAGTIYEAPEEFFEEIKQYLQNEKDLK